MRKIILLMVLFVSQTVAQSIGAGVMIGSPRNEYKKYNPYTGYGLQIQGMLISPSAQLPFGIGLDLGFLIYSSKTETHSLSSAIPDLLVDIERTNSMANMHFVFQISPFKGLIQPYAELYGGGSYIFTTTEIDGNHYFKQIDTKVDYDDFAWSYGAGGGLKFLVKQGEYSSPDIYIDFKVRYLAGSRARFLTPSDIVVEKIKRIVSLFPRESETDLLTFTIGAEVHL